MPLLSGGEQGILVLAISSPVPLEQFVEAGLWYVIDAGERVGEPCLGVDIVELCCADEGVDEGCTFAATV